ncbi:MAG: hypothetical protein ACR2G3_11010 [Solirubrobacterales bacterium]
MSPPTGRPYPRFVADAPQEKPPYGRFEQRLAEAFAAACEPLAAESGTTLEAGELRWFPERAWGGRVYVPVTGASAPPEEPGAAAVEYFGHVSFVRTADEEPTDLRGEADFTDVTAAENPEWNVDLNDDVIGQWRADGERGGDVTLIWGLPMVRGAVAATAELDEQIIDQAAINDGRFTLVAVDAVHGFGDDHYLDVVLWDRRMTMLARESLYEADEE